jgi:RND family efflux transporter MFP subunit
MDETRVARVQTKLEGFVDHLYVSAVGETVAQGQPLFSVFHRRAYSMAQAEFLEASLTAAGMGTTAGPNAQKQRIANAETARAARQQLEMLGFSDDQIAAVSRAHQPLTSLPVGAPISGVIVEYRVALNQKLSMEPLLTIADLSSLWAVGDFSPGDAAAIRNGQAATLTVPYYPGKEFQATVQAILPAMDPLAHTVKVRIEIPNPALLLKPEMFGQIELRAGSGTRKLTVPAEAVLDSGLAQTVFADLGNGYVEPITVKTGERFGGRIEILQGLREGNPIVTSGAFLLDSETRIRSRD